MPRSRFIVALALLLLGVVATRLLHRPPGPRSSPGLPLPSSEAHATAASPRPAVADAAPGSPVPDVAREIAPAETAASALRPPPTIPATPRVAPIPTGIYHPPPVEGEYAEEFTRIGDLASTYEAGSVPDLAAYLTHASGEVRTAALEGLLQLGEKDAAPLLRAAAARTKDPREAVKMLDAAAYLELPPMPVALLKTRRAAAKTEPVSPAGTNDPGP